MPPRRSTRKRNHEQVGEPGTSAKSTEDACKDIVSPNADKQGDCSSELSAIDKIRIENNRQRALQLRQARKEKQADVESKKGKMHKVTVQEVDTGAGFFMEESEDGWDDEVIDSERLATTQNDAFVISGSTTEVQCEECCRSFALSFLLSKFGKQVCDGCHDREKYKLITRTTAKNRYLLKDSDLDRREPILKFITKKNPRNNFWGEMKLYLESQVHERAMEIWQSMENIEEESTKRKILNAKVKSKKYEKKMTELKKEVRSSLYKIDLAGHRHEYSDETYNEQTDEYTKQCKTCNHTVTYEKM